MLTGFGNSKSPTDYLTWASKQVYIASGFALAACTELEIDSCPMEGFDPKAVGEIIGIQNNEGSSPVDGIYLPNILALWRRKTCIEKNPEFETRKQEKLSSSFHSIYPHQKPMKLLV